jgi:anaerobic magnesium-protoporphyrin IX monomethyl ester cyclase
LTQVALINAFTHFPEFYEALGKELASASFAPCPPLGIMYMTAVLEKAGFSCQIVDCDVAPDNMGNLSQLDDCDVVGISACTATVNSALEIAAEIKRRDSSVTVVLGGPHVTFTAEETVKEESVDVVVRGEGEETLLELAQYFLQGKGSLKEILGITYREGRIKSTPDRPFIEDLDALPFPARHLVDCSRYLHPGGIVTGRGCPYRCQFCAAGPLSGHTYRVRTLDNVLEEIRECYYKFRIRELSFVDNTFTAYPERTLQFCEMLKKSEIPVTWGCYSRVNVVSPQILETMADAGCTQIQYGAESGSDSILKSIGKGITTDMVRQAVKWALNAGMCVECSFIIGHPEDTLETVEQTIQFAEELKSLDSQGRVFTNMGVATPYPGTLLAEHSEELGITVLSRDWDRYNLIDPVINTKFLDHHDLRKMIFDVTAPGGGGT